MPAGRIHLGFCTLHRAFLHYTLFAFELCIVLCIKNEKKVADVMTFCHFFITFAAIFKFNYFIVLNNTHL